MPGLKRLGQQVAPSWTTSVALSAIEGRETPFGEDEYRRRVGAAFQALDEKGTDSLVVFRASTVEYLCGFHTVETVAMPLVLSAKRVVLCVPDAEVGRAVASSVVDEVWHYGREPDGTQLFAEALVRFLGANRRVVVELSQPGVPWAFVGQLRALGVTVVDGGFLVEQQRLVLSEAELDCVRAAAILTQRGIEAAVDAASASSATESTIASAVLQALTADANSVAAFGPVIVSGWRAGLPHSTWASRPVEPGSAIFVEISGANHRYHAPVMRTLVRDGAVDPVTHRLAELARTYLAVVSQSLQAGKVAREIAFEAEGALGELEEEIVFHRCYGYPVGLAHPPTWMDGSPFQVVADNPGVLKRGMVLHLPGSFRWFGRAGVGLSQTMLITEDGAQSLTLGRGELIHV